MIYPWDGKVLDKIKGGRFTMLADSSKNKFIQHAKVYADIFGFIDVSILVDAKNN